jgi:hypothetical protein
MAGRRRNVNIGANSIVYSGRGRPRTKETVDRPLPVGIVLGSPSPGSEIYRNRKIRVGGPFQAKVPKRPCMNTDSSNGSDVASISSSTAVYQSCRPPPALVSRRYPHLTEEELTEFEREQQQEENDHNENNEEKEGKNQQ